MGSLKPIEKKKLEKFLEMGGGFVAYFSNSEFQSIIAEAANIDVYDESTSYHEYTSKAKKLRHLWSIEENSIVGRVLMFMCDEIEAHYLTNKDDSFYYAKYDISLLDESKSIAARLTGTDVGVELPKTQDETLSTLMEHIKEQLVKNDPVFALDRLHTFTTKMIREICENYNIQVTNPKGENLPLHSLIGMLRKYYEQKSVSEFSIKAIKANISLFEEFNNIRNKKSYAHDNEIMDKAEAEYVIKTVAAAIKFIDQLEHSINKAPESKLTMEDIAFRLSQI